MPAYFALGFIALVLVLYLLKALSRVDPVALANVLRYAAIALALLGLVLLIVGGKIGLVMMAASLGYPLWRRWQAHRQTGGFGRRAGRSSGVDTAYLAVSLDHDTGTVDGYVKQGHFAGRRLGELSQPELVQLLDEVRRADPEAIAVLEAYLDRIHGPEWRNASAGGGGNRATGRGPMAREEALAMLGLPANADEAQIREAHHRLMLKLHPDHGGSDYLAARLNEARDVLLGG
jgi:hypothetical protein